MLLWGILVEGTLPIKVGKVRVGPIAVGLIFLVALAPSVSATVLDCPGQPTRMHWPVEIRKWPHERTEMIRRLSFTSKPNLVIVRYPSPDWDTLEELVYNGAIYLPPARCLRTLISPPLRTENYSSITGIEQHGFSPLITTIPTNYF